MSARRVIPERDERNFAAWAALNSRQLDTLGEKPMGTAFLILTARAGANPEPKPSPLNWKSISAFHYPVKCHIAINLNL